MSMRSIRCLVPIVLIPLVGCMLPRPGRPVTEAASRIELPEMWTRASGGYQGAISTGWLDDFEDPEMKAMVEEALARNQGLRISEAQLEIARENLAFGRAPLLPSLNLGISGGDSWVRERGFDSWDRSGASWSWNAGVSWEVDVWGRLRDLDRATRHDHAAQEADMRGARLSLAAAVARAWCNLITTRQQLELARRTRENYQVTFRITERPFKAGDITIRPLSVLFAKNNLVSADRSVLSRQLALDEAKRTLELLLGRYPAAEIEARDRLPDLPATIPAGLPSELLMRRPDLVAAAEDLLASARRARAARKELLPAINLSGNLRGSDESLADLLVDPARIAFNLAESLSQPVFRGGRLQAQARQAFLRNRVRAESFVATALQAYREVESALDRDSSLAAQQEFLEVELAHADVAEAQANREFSEGVITFIQVLEAQRRAVNARNAMISLRNQRIQNRIVLHLALGGDFSTLPPEDAGEIR